MLRLFIEDQYIGYLGGFLEGVGIPRVASSPKTSWQWSPRITDVKTRSLGVLGEGKAAEDD